MVFSNFAGRRTRGDPRLHQPEEHPGRGGEGADHLPGDHPQTLLEGEPLCLYPRVYASFLIGN